MANAPYQRASGKGKFAYLGIDLKRPPDLMPQGRAPYLLNVSPDQQTGAMTARAGLTQIGSVSGTPHSIKRLNNALPGASVPWTRFVGAGTSLFRGQTSFTTQETGFSGNPLSLVTYRPPQSPETWLYAYDSVKQKKYKTDGTTHPIGFMPPTAPPVTSLAAPAIKALVDVSTLTGWAVNGSAGSLSLSSRLPTGTTVSRLLIDSGNFGWACIQPTNAASNYGAFSAGMRLTINAETVTVKQMFPSLPSTNVLGIAYDSGTSGLATVSPAVPIQGLERNMLAVINGNSTRVLSVTAGQDGLYSFRCSLPSGIAATQAITFPVSFRAYLGLTTHVAGETISSTVLQSIYTLPANATTASGLVVYTSAADASQVSGRPLTTDDYMHVSLAVDNPNNVQEIHIMLDVDQTNSDFNHNYYYYVVRQSDFQGASSGSQTVTASNLNALTNNLANLTPTISSLQIGQLPYPAALFGEFSAAPSAQQIPPGSSQWFEVLFKLNDLVRVGGDQSVGLSNIRAIGITAFVTATTTVSLGSWWVGGTYGPDANFNSYGNQGQPIIYRYRYRCSTTGARSELSPATRNGEVPWREGINYQVTASADPACDVIDIERNGGTGDTWVRFATVPNATTTYLDAVTETVAQAGDPLELLSYAPWPITDKPRVGVCNIVGTRVVWVSGDTFNTSWIRGVEFIVNNQTYTLQAPPDSATTLHLEQNVGVVSGVKFLIPEATIIGSPLPYAVLGMDGRIFASGDPYNPGLLYFSESYNPDSASDQGYIEITSPSEPLGPPVYYEGAIYVQTASDIYRVDSTPGGVNLYSFYKLSSVSGLSAPWAITAEGPMLAWLGADGIYSYAAQGAAQNITINDLYPLFPFESRTGLPIAVGSYTIYPPDYTALNKLRLSFADGFLIFDYQDSQGSLRTLVYNDATKGWIPYNYTPDIVLHYQEEGVQNPATIALGSNGSVNQVSKNTDDNGIAFTCVVVTPADDQGETRAKKQYGDLMLDYSGTVTATVSFDNYLLTAFSLTATASSRSSLPIDLARDNASLHHNIALSLSWASNTASTLYEWQPSFLPEPEDTLNRPTDWLDAGTMHYKFVHGCRITADTGGVSRTVQVQYDGGINGPLLIVNHSGELVLPYSFPPFRAHLIRLVPTDGLSWRLMNVEWEVDIEPEPTSYWVTQPTSFGLPGYLHMRDCQIAYASLQTAVLTMIVDGVSYTLAQLTGNAATEVKQYFPAPPAKGKIWQLYGTGTALQIYQQDCEFRMKSWGGDYVILKPWGDLNMTSGGAKI